MAMNIKSLNRGLWLRVDDKLKLIEYDSIIHIVYRNGQTELLLHGGMTIRIPWSMNRFEERAPKNRFFRIHRKIIINPVYLKKYDPVQGVSVVKDGLEFPVSRRRQKPFERFLKRHQLPDHSD